MDSTSKCTTEGFVDDLERQVMGVSRHDCLGSRTVMEYLLSPVQKVTHEAGREM